MATTHRKSYSKIYTVYLSIRQRCNNPHYKQYQDYWWRWIKCMWNNFEDFYEDMWVTYKDWLSIDRIDNNFDYCKENCKWSTAIEQQNNTRKNRYFEYNWKKQTLSMWARELWINRSTLSQRYYTYWWDINRVLSYNI